MAIDQILYLFYVYTLEKINSKTGVYENIIIIGEPSETVMSDQRPTCLIGDRHARSKIHQRPTCLIRTPSETDMPAKFNLNLNIYIQNSYLYILYAKYSYWKTYKVFDKASGFPMGWSLYFEVNLKSYCTNFLYCPAACPMELTGHYRTVSTFAPCPYINQNGVR